MNRPGEIPVREPNESRGDYEKRLQAWDTEWWHYRAYQEQILTKKEDDSARSFS